LLLRLLLTQLACIAAKLMTFTAVETANGTLTPTTVATVTFGSGTIPTRYDNYVISNDTSTGSPIYVTTNGAVPTVGGQDCEEVMPGGSITLANSEVYWNQSSSVIPAGTLVGGGPSQGPAVVQPFGSALDGGVADPGNSIQLISAAAQTYTVTGTG
jgi:hypothetical protein